MNRPLKGVTRPPGGKPDFMKRNATCRKAAWILAAFLGANILLKLFFFEIYHVGGNSMYPTLLDGDYVLVSKCSYGLRLPRTVLEIPWVNQFLYYTLPASWLKKLVPAPHTAWKCVGYHSPRAGEVITFHLPFHPRIVNVKRVVDTPQTRPGLIPGKDTVIDSDTLRHLSSRLKDSYGKDILVPSADVCQTEAKENASAWAFGHAYYFVTGDNAEASTDSRQWGLLQENYVIGKVICILFSLDADNHWRKGRTFRRINESTRTEFRMGRCIESK